MNRMVAAACGALLGGRLAGAPAGRGRIVAPREPSVLVPRERPTRREFYGWEILVLAEPASLVAAGSVLLPDKPLGSVVSTVGFLVAMPVYALGGPIVHWRHGAFQKGLLAFGGNVAFPPHRRIRWIEHSAAERAAPQSTAGRVGFSRFAVGVLVAPIVDAVALGWDDVPIRRRGDGPRQRPGARASGAKGDRRFRSCRPGRSDRMVRSSSVLPASSDDLDVGRTRRAGGSLFSSRTRSHKCKA